MTKEIIQSELGELGFTGLEYPGKEKRDGKKRLVWTLALN
jgi:hypothetical protein